MGNAITKRIIGDSRIRRARSEICRSCTTWLIANWEPTASNYITAPAMRATAATAKIRGTLTLSNRG